MGLPVPHRKANDMPRRFAAVSRTRSCHTCGTDTGPYLDFLLAKFIGWASRALATRATLRRDWHTANHMAVAAILHDSCHHAPDSAKTTACPVGYGRMDHEFLTFRIEHGDITFNGGTLENADRLR